MYTLPSLGYEYDALAPVISADIMRLHHTKHHQAYIDKLNGALEVEPGLKELDLPKLLAQVDSLPDSVRQTIRNHGGGHYNHSLFWEIMSPNGGGEPSGQLAHDLVQKYGSFDAFVEQFNAKAVGLFGSGWVWLTPELETVAMLNQDNPLMTGGTEPLMGLDVWEHAYYLDYQNKRDEYIKNWWKVIDWTTVEQRYAQLHVG